MSWSNRVQERAAARAGAGVWRPFRAAHARRRGRGERARLANIGGAPLLCGARAVAQPGARASGADKVRLRASCAPADQTARTGEEWIANRRDVALALAGVVVGERVR